MIKKENKEKISLWDTKQENACGYCLYAKRMVGNEQVICQKKKNIFEFNHCCRKFKFDILKKDVRRRKRPNFNKYSSESFTL